MSHLPAYTQTGTKHQLLDNGGSGTIYALAFPDSMQVLEQVLDGGRRDHIVREALDSVFNGLNDLSADDLQQRVQDAVTGALADNRGVYTDIY